MKQKYEHLWWPSLTDCRLWGYDWSRTPAAPLKSVICVCIGTMRPTGCSPSVPELHTVWRQVCAWEPQDSSGFLGAASQHGNPGDPHPTFPPTLLHSESNEYQSPAFLGFFSMFSHTGPQYVLAHLIPSVSPMTWSNAASTMFKVSFCDPFDKPLLMGIEESPTRFLAPGLWRAELWVHRVGEGCTFSDVQHEFCGPYRHHSFIQSIVPSVTKWHTLLSSILMK